MTRWSGGAGTWPAIRTVCHNQRVCGWVGGGETTIVTLLLVPLYFLLFRSTDPVTRWHHVARGRGGAKTATVTASWLLTAMIPSWLSYLRTSLLVGCEDFRFCCLCGCLIFGQVKDDNGAVFFCCLVLYLASVVSPLPHCLNNIDHLWVHNYQMCAVAESVALLCLVVCLRLARFFLFVHVSGQRRPRTKLMRASRVAVTMTTEV